MGCPNGSTESEIGFLDKNTAAEASGCRTKGLARISMPGVVASSAERDWPYDTHLAVNRPDCKVDATGPNLYHATVMIMRGSGHYLLGRKTNSRGTADGECGSTTGD